MDRKCLVEECTKTAKAKNYCGTHYERWRKHGDPSVKKTPARPRSRAKVCEYSGCRRRTFLPKSNNQRFCEWDCRQRELGTLGRICTVEDCGRPAKTRRFCGMHQARFLRTGQVGPPGPLPSNPRAGRGWINNQGYRMITVNGRPIGEHRHVMEVALGRRLLSHEEVHHRFNGDRTDNRLENLELWSTSQPAGQRVTDKVAWAVELLELYALELLATKPTQLRLVI